MRYLFVILLMCSSCGSEATKTKTVDDYLNELESTPFDIFYRGWLRTKAESSELEPEEASSVLKAKFEQAMPLHSDFSGVDACILEKLTTLQDEAFQLEIDQSSSKKAVYQMTGNDCPDYAKNLDAANTRDLFFSTSFITYLDECNDSTEPLVDPVADLSRRCLLEGKASSFLVLVTQITRYLSTLGDEIAVVTHLQAFGENRSEACLAGQASSEDKCQLIKGRYEVNLDTEEEYIEVFQASILAGYLGKKRDF